MAPNTETTGELAGVDGGIKLSSVFRGRSLVLFASVVYMAAAGGICMFGLYSGEIKEYMSYDQSSLNLLGFWKEVTANMDILSALLLASISIPASLLLVIRAVGNFAGYLMILLTVTGKVDKPELWQVCIYFCLVANLQSSANNSVIETVETRFSQHGRFIRLILKGFLHLSPLILTQIDFALYGDDDPKSLILLLTWLPAVICVLVVLMILTSEAPVRQQKDAEKVLYRFLCVFISLTLFLTATGITQKLVQYSQACYSVTGDVVFCFFFILFAIALREELVLLKQKDPDSPANNPNQSVNNLCTYCSTGIAVMEENSTILKSIFSINMIILFVTVVFGIGAGLTAIDNLGQIAESLQYTKKTVKISVSIGSFWIYIGKIFAATTSEQLITKYKFPRPYVSAAALILASLGHLLIAFPVPNALYVSPMLIGFSYGVYLSLLKPIIGDLFGPKDQETLFNITRLGCLLGSYLFNVKVVGFLYDREALKMVATADVSELTCIGPQCFRQAFFILTIVSVIGGVALIVLGIRMKNRNEGCTCNNKLDVEMPAGLLEGIEKEEE